MSKLKPADHSIPSGSTQVPVCICKQRGMAPCPPWINHCVRHNDEVSGLTTVMFVGTVHTMLHAITLVLVVKATIDS